MGEDTATRPGARGDGFQLGPPRRQKLTVLVDGVATKLDVRWNELGPRVVAVVGA